MSPSFGRCPSKRRIALEQRDDHALESEAVQEQGEPVRRQLGALGEPRVDPVEAHRGAGKKCLELLGSRHPESRFAHQRCEVPLEGRPRRRQFVRGGLLHRVLVQPRQVNEHFVGIEAAAVALQREHQFEEAAAQSDNGETEAMPAVGQPIDEGRVVPLRVEPHHEPALSDLPLHLRRERRGRQMRGVTSGDHWAILLASTGPVTTSCGRLDGLPSRERDLQQDQKIRTRGERQERGLARVETGFRLNPFEHR